MPGIRVVKPVNNCFSAVFDYLKYYFFKTLTRYNDDVSHKLQKITNKIALQIEDRVIFRKYLTLVRAFLQDLK